MNVFVVVLLTLLYQMSNAVDFSLQMTLGQMKEHLRENADNDGNLWCHQEGCRGTYTPYRVNTWGLRKTSANKEEGRKMVDQQVTNTLRHLEKVHNIPKHEVTEDILPKGTPPFPGRECMSCSGHVSLGVCELRIVPCESAKGVYKSRLFTQASLSIRLELN